MTELILILYLVTNCFLLDINGKKFCSCCWYTGLKSQVTIGLCGTTSMGTSSYYNEYGEYIYYNPNKTFCNFHCSNNHKWNEVINNALN